MPFQITYGTGRVAGFVGSDTVTLGSNPAVQVQRQGFGGVFDSSMDFLSASCDGLFVSPFLLSSLELQSGQTWIGSADF